MLAINFRDPIVQSVFDAMPDGVLAVLKDGRILFANKAAGALLGFQPDELQGQAIGNLVPAFLMPRPTGSHAPVAAKCKDGRRLSVEINLVPNVWEDEA